ncbi:hypothetical protein OJ997_08735 [Solirubrobacter phytolaccae]|uniref:Ig-like domain-containing protein n=1 Tax=Solirubrobacter phytolaccae TaxID=1404360 RepID=A0A9X3SAK8_9ACTN|nr:hypothetical protein [Solirubrobacter phytolaccae]MDA0180380.1 hypothetical protein [Solirubrobacter phytolaccae]
MPWVIPSWGIGDTPLVPVNLAQISNPHSGTVGDPTNPDFELRVAQTGADGAPVDPASLQVTAQIVRNGNRVSPFGDTPAPGAVTVRAGDAPDLRRVAFTPVRIGNAKVVVTVTGQGGATASYTIDFYASKAASSTSRYLHLTADTSTAIDAGDGYLFIAGDEHRQIRLYDAERSGVPIALFHPGKNPNDSAGGEGEDDFEASARSGDSVFWLGSQSNSRKGEVQPSRHVVYETTIAGRGKDATLARVGAYGGLRRDLIAWDTANGRRYGFAAGSAEGAYPSVPDGFNIEGAEFAPDGTTLYLGFRAPLVGRKNGGDALIVPVTNIQQLTRGQASHATFGTPIELDFDGGSIRELRRNAAGEYLILTNDVSRYTAEELPTAVLQPALLWYWDGNPATEPQRLGGGEPLPPNVTDVSASLGSWEGIGAMPERLEPGSQVRLIMDQGYDHLFVPAGPITDELYYDMVNKDSRLIPTLMKARTDLVTLTGDLGYQLTVTGLAAFAEQLPGTTSAPRTATITNTGRKTVPVDALSVRGGDAGDFQLDPGSCARITLAPGDACSASLRYAPARGAVTSSAQLEVTSSAPLFNRSFGLTGTAGTGTFATSAAPTIDIVAPRVGDRLTATVAAWSPAAELRYQWLRGGAPIPGAAEAAYTATAADEGFTLSVRVTGTTPGYESKTRTSVPTAAVAVIASAPEPPFGGVRPPTILSWEPVRSRYAIEVVTRSGRQLRLTVRAPRIEAAKLSQRVTVKVAGIRATYRVTLRRGQATLKLGAKAKRLKTGTRAIVTVTVPELRYLVDKQPSGQQSHEVPSATKRIAVKLR